ncbi:BolA-like protein 2 [Seminavis robusta]|uniref:BolA-like protein 2 n=1 Tax=Seminavis robusta TaxID=568900 RepID=A0A9N8EEY5_9STRA|nr:BolA-like protein 2 [Seminavis robusta]|eukprot:Sro901_g218050.1 BolA-like protein 2 (87) ;mRNA; r:31091-31450
MGIEEEIQEKVAKALEAEHVACTDISGGSSCDGGYKLELIVVSPKFEGVALLKRHRMVNEILQEDMSKIHALTMKTWTPAQYESKK